MCPVFQMRAMKQMVSGMCGLPPLRVTLHSGVVRFAVRNPVSMQGSGSISPVHSGLMGSRSTTPT